MSDENNILLMITRGYVITKMTGMVTLAFELAILGLF